MRIARDVEFWSHNYYIQKDQVDFWLSITKYRPIADEINKNVQGYWIKVNPIIKAIFEVPPNKRTSFVFSFIGIKLAHVGIG